MSDSDRRTYEALVVDFGGVLTTPLQESLASFADELGIELQDLVRLALAAYMGEEDNLVVQFETGKIPEEVFAAEFAKRLSEVTRGPVDAEGLIDRLFARLRPEESMFAAVEAVKRQGFKTGLLSNSWGLRAYPRGRFDGLFDAIVISGEVGLRKPDPEIFTMTSERLGVAPSACVFVDDEPGHLKAALEVGMTTVLHRSPAETISELESRLGITLTP